MSSQPLDAHLSPQQKALRDFCLRQNDRSQTIDVHIEPMQVDEEKGTKPGGFFIVQQQTRFSPTKSVVFISEAGMKQIFGQWLAAEQGFVWVPNPMIQAQMSELAKQAKG